MQPVPDSSHQCWLGLRCSSKLSWIAHTILRKQNAPTHPLRQYCFPLARPPAFGATISGCGCGCGNASSQCWLELDSFDYL